MTDRPRPVLPERRLSPGRVILFAALLVAVSWGLGTFAAWPWQASRPDDAVLRISLKHVTALRDVARPGPSDEEIARRPAHMRPLEGAGPTTGRRAEAVLTVVVDGRPALTRRYQPTGLRHDGPVYGYEELPVAPGPHEVIVTLTDDLAGAAPRTLRRALHVPGGRAPLLEYAPDRGWRAPEGPVTGHGPPPTAVNRPTTREPA